MSTFTQLQPIDVGVVQDADAPIRFGDFFITGVLGRGGMATVVRARSPQGSGLPETVALKFLSQDLCRDERAVEWFRAEGALGMRLRHPSLCRTFALEVRDGRLALVMELVEGVSLSALFPSLLKTPALPSHAHVVARIASQVLRALHTIHEARDDAGQPLHAVHRDVSPHNILVGHDGNAKLLDMGIVSHDRRAFETTDGKLKGKLAYAAPEYLLGRSWDHRADVWSAGVVLWEMLTGRHLFRTTSLRDTALAVSCASVPPIGQLAAFEPALGAIVERMLERDPEARFATARAAAEALEAWLAESAPHVRASATAEWVRSLGIQGRSGLFPSSRVDDAEAETTLTLDTKARPSSRKV